MKKKIFNKLFWLPLVILAFGGCESDKEFLTEKPVTFYTTDNAFSSSAQIDQVIVGIYSQLRDMWANPTEQGYIFVFRGNGSDMFDVASIRRSNTFNDYGTINPEHSNFLNIYSAWYQIIAKANLALYAAELPQISWSSDAEKKYMLAQARFFRAFAYRNLGELFGGVPIVTEVTTAARFDFERASRTETYQLQLMNFWPLRMIFRRLLSREDVLSKEPHNITFANFTLPLELSLPLMVIHPVLRLLLPVQYLMPIS